MNTAESSIGTEKSERWFAAMVFITALGRKALRLSLVSKGHKAIVLSERLGSKTRIAMAPPTPKANGVCRHKIFQDR